MKGIITRLSESVKLILEGPMKEGSVLLVRKTQTHRDFSFFFLRGFGELTNKYTNMHTKKRH